MFTDQKRTADDHAKIAEHLADLERRKALYENDQLVLDADHAT